ncbi:MAG: HAD family phosphatase [Candidatus Aquilonibacter sp.]
MIFDLDGTLIESEQIWGDVRHAFVIEHGGHWPEGAQEKMIGMRTTEWARYIHDDLSVALSPEAIAEQVVNAVAQRLAKDVPILPGASEALERLAAAFPLGLATSAARALAKTVLAITGWQKYFEVVVSADDVARGKPAPDVYLRALELMQADPRQTAAIEDSANGIRSAHAAQLAVIAIPNREFPPDPAALALATRVLARIGELDVATINDALANR